MPRRGLTSKRPSLWLSGSSGATAFPPSGWGKAGISCMIGQKEGKTLLLRADMDALPMAEESGLPFAATNGNCHSCGHDCHTAMLLAAAKMLSEDASQLNGRVKLMFQPAEEKLAGAADMLAAGILENPKVDAALAMHLFVGGGESCRTGQIAYKRGCVSFSGDAIRITVTGKNAHGGSPQDGVDAINIAAHIVIALQEILAREVSCADQAVVLVGMINGGSSCNTMSGSCVLEASVRSDSREQREFLKTRVKEISESVAATFRGKADVEFVYGMPSLYNEEGDVRRDGRLLPGAAGRGRGDRADRDVRVGGLHRYRRAGALGLSQSRRGQRGTGPSVRDASPRDDGGRGCAAGRRAAVYA